MAGKRVTFSFFGSFRSASFWSFLSPVQYMLQPMKKRKINAGRSRIAKELVRFRLRFLAAKFVPASSLCRWQDKL